MGGSPRPGTHSMALAMLGEGRCLLSLPTVGFKRGDNSSIRSCQQLRNPAMAVPLAAECSRIAHEMGGGGRLKEYDSTRVSICSPELMPLGGCRMLRVSAGRCRPVAGAENQGETRCNGQVQASDALQTRSCCTRLDEEELAKSKGSHLTSMTTICRTAIKTP